MKRIYLDNAATTPLSPGVKEEMKRVMDEVYGNPSSIHAEGRIARTLVESARKTLANAIHASIGEVFFTSCGSESNNMVLTGAVRDLGVTRIISSPVEHHCILHTLDYLKSQYPIEVVYLNVNKKGLPDLEQLSELLRSGVQKTLVSLMHANNEIGSINDIEKVAGICKEFNALFHTDTTQTIGHLEINVSQTPIHFLSGSAHKFYGPKGTGFVFIHSDHQIKPFIFGGSQERNMRAGTENIIGIAGMAKALEEVTNNREVNYQKILELRTYLEKEILESFEDVYINGDNENAYFAKILSVSFPPSPKNEMLLMNLDIAGISASGGSACSSGVESKSGVLDYIDEPEDRRTVRFSFSHNNTIEELDYTLATLKTIFPKLIKQVV